MSAAPRIVKHTLLRDFVALVFERAGLGRAHAGIVAQDLVWANLRGADGHGVVRIASYLGRLEQGFMNRDPDITTLFENGATAIMDGDRAIGSIGMAAAMARSIEAAKSHTIGWTWLKNSTHSGVVGYFALMPLEENMAGFVLNATKPLVAAHGSAVAGVGTNPISFAVPGRTGAPMVFDMASSAITMGQLMSQRLSGEPLPENAALDGSGQPTTDAARAATLLPLGGHKGSGLSLMIEMFTSFMVGQPLIGTLLDNDDQAKQISQNALLVAVNIGDFMEIDAFGAQVEDLVGLLKAQPRRDGFSEILLPGERGWRTYHDRLENGIPLSGKIWDMLADVAQKQNVEPLG